MSWAPSTALEAVMFHMRTALPGPEATDDGVRVTTHCMYPSNGFVRVYVKAGSDTALVSDEGEAVGEALSAGIVVPDANKLVRHLVTDQGLLMRRGVIYTPQVPIEALPVAISLVANAAKEVAQWLYDHQRVKRGRDFRKILADYLKSEFNEMVTRDEKIVGASNKPHRFANVINFPSGVRLIVDSVAKDASSINARVVANFDVRSNSNPLIDQRIVYDDTEKWSAADLNLLKVGATVVPFSRAADVITRLAREARASW